MTTPHEDGPTLGSMQRRLWASQRLHPDDALQNMVHLSHIDGQIDADHLAAAFASVVAASDVLRTRIVETSGAPRVTLNDAPAPTTTVDVGRDEVLPWATHRSKAIMDLAERPYDSVVVRHEDNTASWYLALHHSITDATSSALVFAATAAAYFGDAPHFGSYYKWSRAIDQRSDRRTVAARRYWEDRPSVPRLGQIYRNVNHPTTNSTRVNAEVDEILLDAVDDRLAGDFKMLSDDLAWSTLLLTVAAVHVHRITGAEDFAIGLPVHGRSDKLSRSIIGPAMELFPVDVSIHTDDTFRLLHKRISRSVMTTLRYAAPGTSPSHTDFDVLVNVIPRAAIGDFGTIPSTTQWIHPGSSDPSLLLQLQLSPHTSEQVSLEVDLNLGCIDPAHLRRAPQHLVSVLRAIVDEPDARVSEARIVDEDELAVIREWSLGSTRKRGPGVLIQLADVLCSTDAVVIEDGDSSLTGPELWDRVERTAAWLRERGASPGQRIAIDMPRCTDSVVAIFATLLAGASYVPLDPNHPSDRRSAFTDRAECLFTITELPTDDELPRRNNTIKASDRRANDEAYVLFTSGSTGEPKGVPITTGALDAYVDFALSSYVEPGARPVAPLFTALTFDLTVTSLFVPLVSRGRLVIIGEDGLPGLRMVANRTDLTWMKATPSHLEVLLELTMRSPGLRSLVVGGEAFPRRLADKTWETFPAVQIFNEYGPTEAVVGCMVHTVSRNQYSELSDVPIGVPAPGVELRVLDGNREVVPIGATGELYIAHAGLSRGYLGRPVGVDPFVRIEDRTFYRSGDLVRLIDDKTLTYVGRIDEQLKVGGIRLDPSEVEHALAGHKAVARSAVRLWSSTAPSGESRQPLEFLTAWIELTPNSPTPTRSELRAFLSSRLPSHAIPSAFVPVQALPFTSNGKLDASALPDPVSAHRTDAGSGDDNESELESIIVDAYCQALGLDNVGPSDDFFDLGGDSLAALEMVMILSSQLQLQVREEIVFTHATPRELESVIGSGAAVGEQREDATPGRRAPGEPPQISEGEAALLYEHLSDPSSPKYNVGRTYMFDESVDQVRLQQAVLDTVARHVPLIWTYGEFRRKLEPHSALDIDSRPKPLTVSAFHGLAAERHLQPFDLDNGPLGRLLLRPLEGGGTGLSLAFHHVSIYAGSFDRLWSEIEARYQDDNVEELAFDYADHTTWQQARNMDQEAAFWSSAENCRTAANVGFGSIAPGHDGYVELAASFTADELRSGPGPTSFATVLSALASILHRRADGDLVGIGITTDTRDHSGAEPLVGYYLNTLPLLIDLDGSDPMTAIAERCGRIVGSALARRTYPYSRIVADRRRAGLEPPATKVLLAFEELDQAGLGGLKAHQTVLASGHAVTDATFFVQQTGNQIDLGLEFKGSVLDRTSARLLLADLDTALRAAIDEPGNTLDQIALPSVVGQIPGPAADFAPTPLLIETIREQATTAPNSAALRYAGTTITYAMLDERSSRIARSLRDLGAGAGTFVGIDATRSADTVVGILGVLKSGAGYVPIDPDYPNDHVAHVIDDAGLQLIVAASDGADRFADHDLTVVDARPSHPPHRSSVVHIASPAANDPAYMIYTSGSTGRPKGVVVTHANITHSTRARTQTYSASVERFLLLSSFAFDSSMVGVFWTLQDGGTVIVPEPGQQRDVWEIGNLIASERASHILALPSLYQLMLSECDPQQLSSLTTVIVAGEACHPNVAAAHHRLRTNARMFNEYGPTEATVWTHVHEITADDGEGSVPIGTAIPGVTGLVIDRLDRPVPIGAPGELLVSGPTVTSGYHRDPDLTTSRFVHLLGTDGIDASTRWYRTGDVVEVTDRHDLVFRGRVDDQVKIRGFRVELGNVEATALKLAGVEEVVATCEVARESDTSGSPTVTRLALWFVASNSVVSTDLRAHLRGLLPDHMVPTSYAQIDALPRTPNGKIDKAALPRAVPIATDTPSEAGAATAEQSALIAVWTDVLGGHISINDNFFDLGGDSIISIQVVARLRKLGYSLTPRDVFTHQTIAELSTVIARHGAVPAEQGLVTGSVPLTPIQHWFFGQNLANVDHWNQSLWLQLDAETDLAVLERAAQALSLHHDALRLRFARTQDGWQQSLTSDAAPCLFAHHGDLRGERRSNEAARVDASLDIGAGRLMAAATFSTSNSIDLYVSIHHLAIDAVSWAPLLEDWATIYGQLSRGLEVSLGAKTTSFRDWSRGLSAVAERTGLADFWLKQSPPSAPSSTASNFEGRSETIELTADEALTRSLLNSRLTQEVLLTGAAVAIGSHLQNEHVDLMLEGHGREEQLVGGNDLSRTVGWFTSRFPIRLSASNADGPTTLVSQAADLLRSIPDHGIGYGMSRELAQHPDLADRAEPTVGFNYLGQLDRSIAVRAPFQSAGKLDGPIDPVNERGHVLGVIASIQGARLTLKLSYLPSNLPTDDANLMLRRILDTVVELVETGLVNAELVNADLVEPERAETTIEAVDVFELAPMNADQMSHLAGLLDRLDSSTGG